MTGNQAYIDALKMIMDAKEYREKFEEDVVKGVHDKKEFDMGRFKCFGDYMSLIMPTDHSLFTHAEPLVPEFLWLTLVEKAVVKKVYDCDFEKYNREATVKTILSTLFHDFLRYAEITDPEKYGKEELEKLNTSGIVNSNVGNKFLLVPTLDSTILKIQEDDEICYLNGGPSSVEIVEGTSIRMTAYSDSKGILHSTN